MNSDLIPINSLIAFDQSLSNQFPFLGPDQIIAYREKVIDYITEGINNGYSIALVKTFNNAEEINLKIINFVPGEILMPITIDTPK